MDSVILSATGNIIALHPLEQDIDPALYGAGYLRADMASGAVALHTTGYRWAAGNPPIDLAERVKSPTRQRLLRRVDQITAPILSAYPEAERASWPTRLMEARAVLAAPDAETAIAQTVILAAMAARPGVTTADVVAEAQAIVERAQVFGAISVEASLMREAIASTLSPATSVADIAAAIAAVEDLVAAAEGRIMAAIA